MARLTVKKLKENEQFYKMPKWIYELDLKPLDREVYMISYSNYNLSLANGWTNLHGEIFFYNTQGSLEKLLKSDKRTIRNSFKKLIELDLLEEEKIPGRATRYYLTDTSDINATGYKNVPSNKNVPTTGNKNVPTTSDKNVPRVRISKENEVIRSSSKDEKTTTAPEEKFLKELKEMLLRFTFSNINTQSLKNIAKYSNNSLQEVKEAISFMFDKKKDIAINILVAILKDKDYKVVEVKPNKNLSRSEKIEYMREKLGKDKIFDITTRIVQNLKENDYPVSDSVVNQELGNLLCKKYNKSVMRR